MEMHQLKQGPATSCLVFLRPDSVSLPKAALAILHEDESGNSRPPIQNVGKNGTNVAVIAPAKEAREDCPSTITKLVLGIAAVEMPNASVC